MKHFILALILFPGIALAQISKQPSASEIKLKIKKLNFLGSVLYVAAHPDDENTRIITAMGNEQLAASAYLSMTRGDGGQNLIGPELRDELGLIRTQELLAARRIDGGEQFFTRANDFGYSKSAEETFRIWGKDSILHDVVKVFRQYQPDVIITRFPPDERAGHGHHTASALLATEAFDLAAQPDRYVEQVEKFGTWKPKRLYTNTGRWWNNTINENTPGIIALDVGSYSELLGASMSEIAAISRSQHKTQGFGSKGARGRQLEFLEFQKGERAEKNIFEGIDTRWTRLKGGEKIEPIVSIIIQEFNEENPAASVPALFELRKQISLLEKSVWRDRKLKEVERVIQDCLGLYLEVTADQYWVAPGEDVELSFELVNRSEADVTVERIQSSMATFDTTLITALKTETPILFKTKKHIVAEAKYSDPYWLTYDHSVGLFHVKDKDLIGKSYNNPAVSILFDVKVGKEMLKVERPLHYRWTDPAKGEQARPFEVVPPIFLNLDKNVLIFKNQEPKIISVLIKSASRRSLHGQLNLDLPEGWRAEPQAIDFALVKAGEEQLKTFKVFPSASEMTVKIRATAIIDGKLYDQAVKVISYDHIPVQTLLRKADAKLVRVELKESTGTIAYLKGAGDEVPSALRNMGYDVWEMKNDEVTSENLKKVDAVIMGIRALNTNDRIRFMMDKLLEYVHNGGTLVWQYNTNSDVESTQYSPYSLNISRDRVTDENSEVKFLKPDHRVLNYPNKITAEDFKGWVQERGLYFPDKWDENFEAVLSMHDPGEPAKDGSLLIARYGQGHYVYTGLSFFRELPEGVAGAYKLFSNIVSLSKADKVIESQVQKKKKKGKV